jgi:DNA-binding CsgD family transcriptional regulator
MSWPAEDPCGKITVEVRLSDTYLAKRILDWIEGTTSFVAGAAGAAFSVVIADHIPDDVKVPIVLLIPEQASGALPDDRRAAARLRPDVSPAILRVALEAAAYGLDIRSFGEENNREAGFSSLSAREIEVLRRVAEGATNKSIARSLAISHHTVKFHVAAILQKLGATSRTDAAAQAIRAGLFMV